ncbi:MAG: lanthionine synthetase C family protein [Actinomycetota bacterium]|nr:lanthionine synthetase C family protein [Actinomycetota bacterium]
MTESWRPLLEGSSAARAAEAVDAIAAGLQRPPPASDRNDVTDLGRRVDEASLARGRAGYALFFGCKAEAGDAEAEAPCLAHLGEAIDALASVRMGPSLFMGFCGVAWACDVLGEIILDAEDDPNEAIDDALIPLFESEMVTELDLISGVVGIGVYALQRLPRPEALKSLERVISLLEERAVHTAEGIAWITPPEALPHEARRDFPDGYYNLGMAHGIAGVIALLAGAMEAGVAVPKTKVLLEQAVRWLLAQETEDDPRALFPAIVDVHGHRETSRTAWCYGDAGTAAALVLAATAAREEVWLAEARRVALEVARRPQEMCGVRDACLCHGAAGLAHILNRLAFRLDDEEIAGAARVWIERTLDMRNPAEGVGGFRTYRTGRDIDARWIDHPGLLAGAAGVGLALLAAIGRVAPVWDRAFLLSIPQRSGV